MSDTKIIPYGQSVGALTVDDVRAQVKLIHQIMKEVMQGPSKDNPEGVHYGVIPGTPKPTLYKAGAEKLCLTFRLAPDYEIQETPEGIHVKITSKCILTHIPSGQRFGAGMGSCSTREVKYAYRDSKRKCPKCGAEAIIKGKDFKNDGLPTGWLCFGKKGGCGEKFKDGDEAIEGQKIGRAANEDVADQYNTVLKMANKRSLVAAVLNTTAASDIFTQDVEDTIQETRPASPASPEAASIAASQTATAGGVFLSADQCIALEDALKEHRKSKPQLLANVSKQYGQKIERLSQIKAADYADAIAYAGVNLAEQA